jgi:hypothetical protein
MNGYFSGLNPRMPEDLAVVAIRHVLIRIRNRKPLSTVSFDHLANALAALERKPVAEVRALFTPPAQRQEAVK